MYDIEKRSVILENVDGFARLDTYTYGPGNKMAHRVMLRAAILNQGHS